MCSLLLPLSPSLRSLPPLPSLPPPPLSPTALVGMLHLGIFILLLLSGERNFGVRLNKPFVQKIQLPDIPKFSGSHADLLFLVSININIRAYAKISSTAVRAKIPLPRLLAQPPPHQKWVELHHAFSSTPFTNGEGLWLLFRQGLTSCQIGGIGYPRTVHGNPRHFPVENTRAWHRGLCIHLVSSFFIVGIPQDHYQWDAPPPASLRLPAHYHGQQ